MDDLSPQDGAAPCTRSLLLFTERVWESSLWRTMRSINAVVRPTACVLFARVAIDTTLCTMVSLMHSQCWGRISCELAAPPLACNVASTLCVSVRYQSGNTVSGGAPSNK